MRLSLQLAGLADVQEVTLSDDQVWAPTQILN